MGYRWFAAAGVGCLGATAVLSAYHLGEDNSPLVFGPAFLGIALIVSPLVLDAAAGEGELRPSGRAVLQAFVIPLAGLAMTLWGVLGALGIVDPVSFDGPRQHCRACETTWNLEGKRGSRPHYVDLCEHCTQLPELADELKLMVAELCVQQSAANKSEPPKASLSLSTTNRSRVRVHPLGFDVYARKPVEECGALSVAQPSDRDALAFRLAIDDAGSPGDARQPRLLLRLELFEPASERVVQVVRRERAFQAEAAPR